MMTHTSSTGLSYHWLPDPNGQFSIKSAYLAVINSQPTQSVFHYVWWKTMPPNIRIFLWRLWTNSLPMVNNMHLWSTIFPSQCAFCRMASDEQDHVFLHCASIKAIWVEISHIFSGPLPRSNTIKAHLLRWWGSSSSSSMRGQLRVVTPSMVLWNIWKAYAAVRYGSDSFTSTRLFEQIRLSLYNWGLSVKDKKFTSHMPQLFTLKFLPTLRSARLRIVRWILPPTGRMKLNVDATVGHATAAGAAILCSDQGTFISAITFSLPWLSPLRAEMMTLMLAVTYYARGYAQLIVETDCQILLSMLDGSRLYTGALGDDITRTARLLALNSSLLQYCPREANSAAHRLARYGYRVAGVAHYAQLPELPSDVRGELILDLQLPTLRA